MDNKKSETLYERAEEQIDGIVLYLLKKYAIKKELLPTFDTELQEENEF
ncbi:hypothetical protein OQJ18_08880 [Fluoribacter dumoffii]|uniref:Uncharacterized protein n=1 Tax=Fluoribacter dumoffii TaxID=463 RepID=A0A377G742_9GAMM|nr:hypothetical protein [Fluoribacter dumoffii]MCW8384725.1 hypothetical protein [Fluoribacter dumoffii]MCW8417789.1 hypothetical protein [Fluoribacter dumoffii]MCW8454369.1 hypothetical protein [Fluoribacter dumoffii]MCW8461557.1 hypothetical protein [Fluoribacter dumoffii]MCW8481773.1 hypothetical protein [Fluoribacter dumoffii]